MKSIRGILILLATALLFDSCKRNEIAPSESMAAVRIFGRIGNDIINASYACKDGGVLYCGHVAGLTPGDWDVFAMKTDNRGNVLWFSTLDGERQDDFLDIAETPDGGAVAVGNTLTFGTPRTTPGSSIEPDMLIIKYDANGKIQWMDSVGGGDLNGRGYESATGVFVDDNGDIYTTGITTSFAINPNPNFNQTILKLKYSLDGKRQWQVAQGSNANREFSTSLMKNRFNEMVHIAMQYANLRNTRPTALDFFDLQANRDSSLIANPTIRNRHPLHFEPGKLFKHRDGSLLMAGTYLNDSITTSNIHPNAPCFLKFDDNYNISKQWFYDNNKDFAHYIHRASAYCRNGDIVFIVEKRAQANQTTPGVNMVIRVNEDGNVIYEKLIDMQGDVRFRTIVEMNDKNLMIGLAISRQNISDLDMGFLTLDEAGNVRN